MADGMWRVALPAALVGVVLGGGGWMLASQSEADAAPGKAAARSVTATKYDRVTASGNVFYRVPAGYKAVQQKGGVIMVPRADIAAGELNGYLLLTEGFPLDANVQAKFKASGKNAAVQALAIAIGGLADDPNAKLSVPEQVGNPARDGYEQYTLASRSEDKDAGKTRFTQYVIFLTGDRAEIAMRVAYGSADKLDGLTSGLNALLTSMEFRNAGATAPSRLAAALPTDLAVITPRPKPVPVETADADDGPPKGGGKQCYTVQRQSCSGGFASGMGYFCNTYPQQVCN
jgi:hypothetical protein